MSDNLSKEEDCREQLIARAQRGDEAAFERLLRSVTPAMKGYLARFGLSPQDRDDVLQDVSLRIWRGLSSYRGDAQLTTWCCTVARNAVLNRLKGANAQRQELSFEQLLEKSGVEPAAGIAEGCADSPEEHLQAKERLAELVDAFEALPTEQQLIMEMRYERELDYAEIAQLQNVPVGTVRSRLHRVRQAIGLLANGETN